MSFLSWFMQFALIVAAIGIPAFFIGEMLPRDSFDCNSFLYRCRSWEKDGKIYEKIWVHKWKDYAIDMSKIVKSALTKKVGLNRDPNFYDRMIKETCSAELVHWVLIILSPLFVLFMEDGGGWGMFAYITGNLPSIIIQRYNRPRLIMIQKRLEAASVKKA